MRNPIFPLLCVIYPSLETRVPRILYQRNKVLIGNIHNSCTQGSSLISVQSEGFLFYILSIHFVVKPMIVPGKNFNSINDLKGETNVFFDAICCI